MNKQDKRLIIALISLGLILCIMRFVIFPTSEYRRIKYCTIRIKENSYECSSMMVKIWWNNGVSFKGANVKTKKYVNIKHSGDYSINYFWRWEKR